MRKYYFNESYFENIESEEQAYWLGFVSADGSINKSSSYNSYRLKINISSKDKSHLYKFANSINYDINCIEQYLHFGGFSNINGSDISRLVINSYKMCRDLSKYDVNKLKSDYINIPNIPYDLIKHYIRGYIDGDGYFYYHYDEKNKRYRYCFEITTPSELFILSIQDYLNKNNIITNIYIRNNCCRLMTSSKKEILKIIDLIYADCNICLDRKFEKAKEIKNIAV